MKRESGRRFPPTNPTRQTDNDRRFSAEMDQYFDTGLGDNIDKLRNFPKYVPRSDLSRFLVKNEIFQHVLNVHGHVVECGVFLGGGLMTWAQLSAIYEPYNHVRRVIGFDTFSGFPSVHEKDEGGSELAVEGGLAADSHDDIMQAIGLYDLNRPIGHIPRVGLSSQPEVLAEYACGAKSLLS